MQDWEGALWKFLADWQNRADVVGALVCGSYVTENPASRSDLDLHIILSDEVDWRERGNLYVDGFLIEYFANPPRQIRGYFAEDYADHTTSSMVQFLTGRVLFDKSGIIERLKKEAAEWKAKEHAPLAPALVELRKYGLWDAYDNLQACYEAEGPDFWFVYQHTLGRLFQDYLALLNLERIPYHQISAYLSDPVYLDKYLKCPFPDAAFAELFLEAMHNTDLGRAMALFEALIEQVFQKAGGFAIDGWTLTTPAK